MDLETAEKLLDSKAKPPGSLGALEFWATQLCLIQGTAKPSLEYGSLLIFAGDHGVVAEGVAAYPSAVTASIFATIASGKAASSVIAASQGIELEVIDVGVASDVSKFYSEIAINAKVRFEHTK
jgi:nicotinate-nucleotide--dimethylbenzimidazole phosphoribosyltransferase